jgi:hypothetical protein
MTEPITALGLPVKGDLNNSITDPGLIKAVGGFFFNCLYLFSRDDRAIAVR